MDLNVKEYGIIRNRNLREVKENGKEKLFGMLAVGSTFWVPAGITWWCTPQRVP